MSDLKGLTSGQRERFDDLVQLMGHTINKYGLWWVMEALICQLKERFGNSPEAWEFRLVADLTKALEGYQARYDNED